MKIRYRDAQGHFIKQQIASRRKKVRSEIYDEKTNKKIGESVQGYYTQIKKLAREAMPKIATRKEKEYRPRKKVKAVKTYIAEAPEEYFEDLEEGDFEELEAEWADEYEDDFSELDVLDDLEELLEDEDEWYEHE